MMLRLTIRWTLLGLLLLGGAGLRAQEPPTPMDLIRKAVENDKANDKKAHEYMYIEREANRKKDGKGFKMETETREVFFLYGEEINRLIAKDDKPLSEEDAKKEEEKVAKKVEKLKKENESDRKKREERAAKDKEEEKKFLDEVAEAYDFTMEPRETIGGRETWVIRAEPRKDYRPKMKQAKILPKLRFKVWLDKEETQVTKVEAEIIDNITFGLVLAKIGKGAHFEMETTRVNDEVWLPAHIAVTADARVMLFKHYDFNADITYRDYRKFRAEAKITGMTDATPPPRP